MIFVTDREYYTKVLEFSAKIYMQGQLLTLLARLGEGYWNNGKQYVCILSKDFAPYSFYWTMYDLKDCIIGEGKDEGWIVAKGGAKPWMNGGLIYSGPHDLGENTDENTFSVNLAPHSGWSIHT